MPVTIHPDTPLSLVNEMAMQYGMEVVSDGEGNHVMQKLDPWRPIDNEDKPKVFHRQAD